MVTELVMNLSASTDFLTLIPGHALLFETDESGRVVVLRPKILSPRWTWLLRLFKKPHFRVKLDDRGSFVWLLCDGTRSIDGVAAATQERFDDPLVDSGTRTATFIRELVRGGFLTLDPPPERPRDL